MKSRGFSLTHYSSPLTLSVNVVLVTIRNETSPASHPAANSKTSTPTAGSETAVASTPKPQASSALSKADPAAKAMSFRPTAMRPTASPRFRQT